MPRLDKMSLEDIRDFKIMQVKWHHLIFALGFTLSDDQECKVGAGIRDFTNSHIFDPTKKITKVEVIIKADERYIIRMNFYHHTERLVAVGYSDNDVKTYGTRVEVFSIADDEKLIGCQLYQSMN